MSVKLDDGRRTPPGSPPRSAAAILGNPQQPRRRSSSSGFIYPTVEVSGVVSSSRIVYYDGEIGLLAKPEGRYEKNGQQTVANGLRDYSCKSPDPAFGNGNHTGRRYSNGSVPSYQEMTASRRNSQRTPFQPASQIGVSPQRTRQELDTAKRAIDNKNREIDALRAALENAKTETARRVSQARLFREGDTALRKEMNSLHEEIKTQSDQLREAEHSKQQAMDHVSVMAKELTALRAELVQKAAETAHFKSTLQTSSVSVNTLKERLKEALEKLEEASDLIKQDKATINALRSDIVSFKAREEALERTIDAQSRSLQMIQQSSMDRGFSTQRAGFSVDTSFTEVLIQVALPRGRKGEFLVRLDRGENPTEAAEAFALENQLSKVGTRLLVAFANAECRPRMVKAS